MNQQDTKVFYQAFPDYVKGKGYLACPCLADILVWEEYKEKLLGELNKVVEENKIKCQTTRLKKTRKS
jgi:hypothetical protein